MEREGKAVLNGQVNQGAGLCAKEEEKEREEKRRMSWREIVKEPLCFIYKAETPGYHSVLCERKLNWSLQKDSIKG